MRGEILQRIDLISLASINCIFTKKITHAVEMNHYPESESSGSGWNRLSSDNALADKAGIDIKGLDQHFELQDFLFGGQNFSAVIVRHGQIVYEHASFMGLATSRFDIWSCTKSVTGTAWGMLLDDTEELPAW